MTELRCDSKLHGELLDGQIEVKCSSRWCGAGQGIIVLHRFDALTGDLLATNRYQEPTDRAKEVSHVSRTKPAVRYP